MTLENQVATLVNTTTALQNTVGTELTKVRTENANFRQTVLPLTGGNLSGPVNLPSLTATDDCFFNAIKVGQGKTKGIGNVAVGEEALSNSTTGHGGVAVGNAALHNNTTGRFNTGIGLHALFANIAGAGNTAVGHLACRNSLGASNTGIGYLTLQNNIEGNWNTGVGQGALRENGSGVNNTAIGFNALGPSSNYTNTTGLGANTLVSGNNQVQLGDSSTTTFAFGAVQNRSDARDKADIRPTLLGLDFIKALKPKDFRWDMRDAYRTPMPEPLSLTASDEEKQAYEATLKDWKENNKFANLTHDGSKKKKRIHHGLIAQEVAELIKTTGVDFGGFQDHKISGGEDVLSIGYSELIAPLIKAIQELDQSNEELRGRIAILEARK